ncbi:MAG: Fic family protein [Lachnospiraceae bacterium]|nr:Fic family protein [Lachnospiraceae bacterium]
MDKLHDFERRLTMLRLSELLDKPVIGKFDFEHLQSIHGYIFQDVYEWAGKVRTVDIAKENMFCNVKYIESQAEIIFRGLKSENYLVGLAEEVFIKRLAYYFSEINALHPFREGNGRSQREFIRSLALHNGYIVNFAKINSEDMIKASKKSFLCDYEEMERIFTICVRKM